MAAAERRPVPSFPGKLRNAEAQEKAKYEKKNRWDNSRLNSLAAPRHRPDRVFGTARSANANLPTGKISKQLKPLLISKKSPPKIISEDAAKIPRKPAVRFQDQELPIEKNSRNISILADAPLTPKSLVKAAKSGTPYYSAKSCSNCRFDKLEYVPYWISQIKLAESVGKHFASASFFRLAFECNAQPARSLKSELKRYLARHASLAITDAWKELSCKYGLSEDEHDHGLINFDCAIPPAEENLDPVIQSTKNSDSEVSIISTIEEKGDADDRNKMVMIPCNESSKVMIDNCIALMESPNHPGDIQCLKMGDYDVVSHQNDDLNTDDLFEQKKSASFCTDTAHNGSLNDLHTSDEENISSIIENEPITGDFISEGSSYPDNPKSTAEFDAKGVLEVKDEVMNKQRKDDISQNEVLKDSHISDRVIVSDIMEEENKSGDSVSESFSSSEKSKSRCGSEVKDTADEKKQKGNLDKKKFEIQSEFHASGRASASSIYEEEIKPVEVVKESSSSSEKSKLTGGFEVKGKADKKKQKANSDKKNVKIPDGKRSTAFLTKMR